METDFPKDASLESGNIALATPGVSAAGQELVVADGTVIGANAVLRHSTGVDEIWAGLPARRVGVRADSALTA